MSFGAIQHEFSKRCVKMILEGKEASAKTDLREFVQCVRSKQPLIEQFYVYENIRNRTDKDKAMAVMFIKNTLRQLRGLSRGDILTANSLLRHRFNVAERVNKLDAAIHRLIESAVSDYEHDTAAVTDAFKVVLEHVIRDKKQKRPITEMLRKRNQFGDAKLEFFTPQQVVRIAVKKFNNEFGPLFTESERKLFSDLTKSSSTASIEKLHAQEYSLMCEDVNAFLSKNKVDDDIVRNINLAKKKLSSDKSLDSLLNIVELRTQIATLGGSK